MKRLLSTISWDLKLEVRYQILTVTAFVTALYVVIFRAIPEGNEKLVIALIFSDPAMLGFMFIGALMLFEKSANTLQALVITPIKPWIYIWSKALSLTAMAVVASFIMAISADGLDFNPLFLGLGIIYASVIFVFIGFIGIARVETLNQYMMMIPLSLTPLLIPLLNFFEITDSLWLYLIPSQAILILMEGAFSTISTPELFYGLLYPLPWIWLFYRWAEKTYSTYIIK